MAAGNPGASGACPHPSFGFVILSFYEVRAWTI